MSDLAEQVLNAYRAKGWRLTTAESCTGGMVAAALTDIAGSSDVVECGFVTYSNAAKQSLLQVSADSLSDYGAVSEAVAAEMAQGALTVAGVDVAVSITGIAGPGGSERKPEGRVCFGLASWGHKPLIETQEFGALGRANVRQRATDHALSLLLKAAQG